MTDIFNNKIICSKCNREMQKISVEKNGFKLRAVQCGKCGERIIHPTDLNEYSRFNEMKQKQYKVKLRLVGNSYAVSIPREILNFMNEHISEHKKLMDHFVNLCFEDMRKLSLLFE